VRAQAKVDLMPILTNTGESPFEVGLNSSTPGVQHVLPVFRLPSIKADATFVNTIPVISEPSPEELRVKQRQEQETLQLKARLGLTDAEMKEFSSQAEAIELGLKPDTSESAQPLVMAHPSADVVVPKLNIEGASKGSKRNRSKKQPRLVNRQTPRCLKNRHVLYPSYGVAEVGELRSELRTAVHCVQGLTSKVKEDIMHIHNIVPVTSLRAQLFMKKWGLEKLEMMFQKMQYSLIISALDRWHDSVDASKKKQKREAFLKYRGTMKLDLFMRDWDRRHIAHAWESWLETVRDEQKKELAALQTDAAVRIQTCYRAHKSREFMKLMRLAHQRRREEWAAAKLQSQYRGRHDREQVHLILRKRREEAAAVALQRQWRGRRAREVFDSLLEARELYQAARMVQQHYRGRLCRRAVEAAREIRTKSNAAMVLQARFRGGQGRARYQLARVRKQQYKAATMLQSRYRGRKGRRAAAKARKAKAKHEKKLNDCALRIEATFRGHRGRLTASIRSGARNAERKEQNKAATQIQNVFRNKMAKGALAKKREVSV
jgi:hypothetical protein